MGFLPDDFKSYIKEDCNRAAFIQTRLASHRVASSRIVIDRRNHILVQFGRKAYNPRFKIKTVISHYDRVAGSPGANDNSAANWELMDWAFYLKDYPSFHNVRLFLQTGKNRAGLLQLKALSISQRPFSGSVS